MGGLVAYLRFNQAAWADGCIKGGTKVSFKQFLAAALCGLAPSLVALAADAADYPDPVEGDHVVEKFTFHTGEVIEDFNIHYYTVGDPANEPVLLLHGTTGSGKSMLSEGFAGALFGPGQPLDATRYFLIMPDAIGTGGTTKPSDGMRANFPQYNYDDMVDAQHLLVKDGLGIDHLRLIMGNSMGGMHTWVWGVRYPDFADALIPMAATPGPMSGRNWMMRRMLIDAVRTDPAWNNGNYTEQPPNLRIASAWYGIATSNGNQGLQAKGPTSKEADAYVDKTLASQKVGDANDAMYQWASSADYDPSADLEKITAHVLVINSADDERNPPELGVLETAMPRIEHGQVYLIPASPETSGHGTTGSQADLYADQVADFLAAVPKGD
jgi:homoserine O-acetyltransferase/O-succinyltransferase